MHRHLFLFLCLLSTPALAQQVEPVAERQRAVEEGLLPAVVVKGEPEPAYSIHERMTHYGVPGVSVAVINDGHVEWAVGYGVRQAGGTDSVTVSTLFQAASISKPVTAMAALRLVDQGRIDLDVDVNQWLRSWRVPTSEHTSKEVVTLRRLLSHTAGLTVGGFPGYGSGEAMPSTTGILSGQGNTEAVRIDTIPGTIFRYSGGGYTVAQVLIEDVTAQPFAEAMERLVLQPLGMYRSTFAQPLPARLPEEAALAHRTSDAPIEGGWHVYPEQAAAGLWTTPTDIARFALGVRAAYLGERGAILEQATAREMLTAQQGGYGLGPGLGGAGDGLLFAHPGGNAGYRAFFGMYPATGDGVAVMTNSDSGGDLMMEVVRAVSHAYEWPDFKPEVRSTVEVSLSALNRLIGVYRAVEDPSSEYTVSMAHENGRLYLTLPSTMGGQRVRLLPSSETEFFVEGTGATVVFEPEGHEGELEAFGQRSRRMK